MTAGAATAQAQSLGSGSLGSGSTGSISTEIIGGYTTTPDQGDITYHVTPTDAARSLGSLALSVDPIPEMVDKGIGDRLNIAGQLICHAVFAADKPVWNLEGFRPNVSDLEYITSQCNPARVI